MRSLFEELGGTYTLGKEGMYYPNLAIEETDQRSIGKWGRKDSRRDGLISQVRLPVADDGSVGALMCVHFLL